MNAERVAVMSGNAAHCCGCRTLLATRGADVRLASGLVPRPTAEPRTGLPRFGPPRRVGHLDPRGAAGFLVDASTRAIGNPGAIYVNCHVCDRGQVVRWS